jgi:drug/metabolite transporter (DMT)-like permease
LLLLLGNGCVAMAERTVDSGLAALFIASSPLAAAAFGGVLLGRWPRPVQWSAIALGMAGVAVLSAGRGLAGDPVALGLLVLTVVGWALGSVLSQGVLPVPAGLRGVAMEMLAGGGLMLAASWGLGEAWSVQAGGRAVFAWWYLVVAGSLVAFPAYMYLLSRVPAHVATSYCFVSPVIAAALGAALAGESLAPLEWLAAALIVTAAFVLVRAAARADPDRG